MQKSTKKALSKYTLTKHSNKRLLFTFYAPYAYNYKLFYDVYMQTCEEKST